MKAIFENMENYLSYSENKAWEKKFTLLRDLKPCWFEINS